MDIAAQQAGDQLDLADAELAVLKQEHVVRELLRLGQPTAEGTELLRELREHVERVTAETKSRHFTDTHKSERTDRAA